VRRSVQMIADSFEVSLTEAIDGGVRWLIDTDDVFDLLVDNERVMSGRIDVFERAYNMVSHRVTIKGRSHLRDLLDCSGIHAPWMEQSFVQLATVVCGLFGLKVVVAPGLTDIDAKFPKAKVDPGETYMEFLKRLADERGVILTDTPEGNLLITRAGSETAPTALVLGKNILSANATNNVRDRFYKYIVIGQSDQPWKSDDPENAIQVNAEVIDAGMVRQARTKVLDPDDAVALEDVTRYGERERNARYGESQSVTYMVSGFRHKEGLWQPNTLVYVDDPRSRIKGERLIVDVEFSHSKKSTTAITVMPKEALDIVPLPRAVDDNAFVFPVAAS